MENREKPKSPKEEYEELSNNLQSLTDRLLKAEEGSDDWDNLQGAIDYIHKRQYELLRDHEKEIYG